MTYEITDIKYDSDVIEELPTELAIEVPDDLETDYEKVEYISDEISNVTGFCHFGFSTYPVLDA